MDEGLIIQFVRIMNGVFAAIKTRKTGRLKVASGFKAGIGVGRLL